MIEQLINWDKELFLWLNGFHNPIVDQIMWYATKPLTWLPLYLLLLYFCIRFYRWQTLYIVLFTVLLVSITDQISVHFFKNVFCRLRPSHNHEFAGLIHLVNDYRGGSFGFVSSHAMNYFGLAVFFVVLFGRRYRYFWIFPLLVALITSYSRIYLGVHYPADVACGAILGAAVGFGIAKIFILLSRKVFSGHFKTAPSRSRQ